MMTENERIYEKIIDAIKDYFFNKDVDYLFLHGGCYWLALTLHQYIGDSEIVFNRKMQHCACLFDRKVYDIRGRISGKGFMIATAKDREYMKKHFIPRFHVEEINCHLSIFMENEKGR